MERQKRDDAHALKCPACQMIASFGGFVLTGILLGFFLELSRSFGIPNKQHRDKNTITPVRKEGGATPNQWERGVEEFD